MNQAGRRNVMASAIRDGPLNDRVLGKQIRPLPVLRSLRGRQLAPDSLPPMQLVTSRLWPAPQELRNGSKFEA